MANSFLRFFRAIERWEYDSPSNFWASVLGVYLFLTTVFKGPSASIHETDRVTNTTMNLEENRPSDEELLKELNARVAEMKRLEPFTAGQAEAFGIKYIELKPDVIKQMNLLQPYSDDYDRASATEKQVHIIFQYMRSSEHPLGVRDKFNRFFEANSLLHMANDMADNGTRGKMSTQRAGRFVEKRANEFRLVLMNENLERVKKNVVHAQEAVDGFKLCSAGYKLDLCGAPSEYETLNRKALKRAEGRLEEVKESYKYMVEKSSKAGFKANYMPPNFDEKKLGDEIKLNQLKI